MFPIAALLACMFNKTQGHDCTCMSTELPFDNVWQKACGNLTLTVKRGPCNNTESTQPSTMS